MIICPSILEATADDYLKTIKKLSSYFNYFQIDIADGIYVKNKTANIDDVLNILITNYQLPITNYFFDFHLMTKNYENDIEKILQYKNKINIKNIFIHYDLKLKKSLIYKNKLPITNYKLPFFIGLTINPQDKINYLANNYNLNLIPAIQIMSVNPGAQGNPFIKNTLKKIEQLRILGYKNKIFLDGGINDKTILFILKQKFLPDVICPGSFLAKAKNETELKKRFDFLLKFI